MNIPFLRSRLGKLLRSASQERDLNHLRVRVQRLEERLLGYYKNRWDVVDKLADYLVGSEVAGDYMEFGVFEGNTFQYSVRNLAPLFPEMRFIAFDSFEGLPTPTGKDVLPNDYTSGFHRGQFTCSDESFLARLHRAGVPTERVELVKGWFDQTLLPDKMPDVRFAQAAAAWIDCDLYESTVPVLNFLAPRLSTGSVLLFDDWRCFRNLPDYGEQLACREWLTRNPSLRLHDFADFGFHGKAFTVEKV